MSDFPRHYEHKKNPNLQDRVATTPTEAVNLEARGYTLVEPKAEKAETKTEAKKAAEPNRNS